MIPPIELSVILASKLSLEIIAASLNATETRYSNLLKKPHANARRVYPFWKICQHCRRPFETHTKEQAVRNKACGRACAAAMIGVANAGTKPPEMHKGKTQTTCGVCGEAFFRNTKHLRRVVIPVCSKRCNGKIRGAEWKTHAHKGRAAWTPESERALKIRFTGPTNPAWKGGLTYRNRKGLYATQPIKYVRCPVEFLSMARQDGYVMEHRLLVARAIGRVLLRREAVHHTNHNATDNAPTNLMLFATNAEHKAYEHGADIAPLWCGLCHSGTSAKSGVCECQPARLSRSVAA